MNRRLEAQEADAYEIDYCVGYHKAKRDLKRNGYLSNGYLPKSGAWCGYEAYREGLKVAQQQGAAA